NRYHFTRTYTVKAECLNTATCTQLIKVDDETAPGITCPPAVTVSCVGNVPGAATDAAGFVAQGGTIAADNCGGPVTVSSSDGAPVSDGCASRYHFTRTYTV